MKRVKPYYIIHYAAIKGRSPEFCRVIHEQNSTILKTTDNYGLLPFHWACSAVNVETAKYLFYIYPESIKIPNGSRWYPLHLLAENYKGSNDRMLQLLAFLLKHDKGAVSTGNSWGDLPLHIACQRRKLPFVKLLFDAHPDAIFVRDESRDTPLDIARRSRNQACVVNFLENQLSFHCQSQDDQVPDVNGQLPIHRVLQMPSENVSLGTVKLMAGAHRASVAVADFQGCTPLHYACRLGNLDIVKYLMGLLQDSPTLALDTVDSEGNLPLHHACLGGKLDVINYILDISPRGVFVSNKLGKIPIGLLLFDAICDRGLQYVDTVDSLFRANPVDSLADISPGLSTYKT